MTHRQPITFFRRGDENWFDSNRGAYEVEYVVGCLRPWVLYLRGVKLSRYRTFNELTPAAMRHEATRQRAGAEA